MPGIESCSIYLPIKGHTRKPLGSCELSNDFDIKIPIFLVIKTTVRSSELQKENFFGLHIVMECTVAVPPWLYVAQIPGIYSVRPTKRCS